MRWEGERCQEQSGWMRGSCQQRRRIAGCALLAWPPLPLDAARAMCAAVATSDATRGVCEQSCAERTLTFEHVRMGSHMHSLLTTIY